MNRQDRELSAKLAAVGQAQAQREELLRQHIAEVQTMLHEWESNKTRIVRFEREIIPQRSGDVSINVLDSSRARECLGWQPRVDFEEGIARTWRAVAEERP